MKKIGYENLYNRREEYKINELHGDVCLLTAGVSIQTDRVEIEIVGWCKDRSSYSIDYRVIEGDIADVAVWNKLAELLDERWKRPNGLDVPIRIMAIDSGYNALRVFAFCLQSYPYRVVPVKGLKKLKMVFSAPKTVEIIRAKKRIGKVRLFGVGISYLRSELNSWLRLEKDENGVAPPCYCHFPQYAEHYFRGLTAKQKLCERIGPLECRIFARAAASIAGLDILRPERLEQIGGIVTVKGMPDGIEVGRIN